MNFRLFAAALIPPMFVLCGCDKPAPTAVGPTPAVSMPQTDAAQIDWSGAATVVAATGGSGCGWGRTVGETRTVRWRVTIDQASVVLDEDMDNWPTDDVPYVGTLTGEEFTATDLGGANYLSYVCQFKESSLSGTFSPDHRSFDAVETLVWGPPGGETTVKRRWTVSRSLNVRP